MTSNPLLADLTRLNIVVLLHQQGPSDFMQIKKILTLTDGNLTFHVRKLQDGDLVSIIKSFEQNKPKTRIYLTETGHQALMDHLAYLETIIRQVKADQ